MSLPDFEAWAIFAAVARTSSFTAAARELSLSKPTISKAVSRLEQRLGTVLFHRTSRKISLSTAGKALLPHAQRIAAEGEAAMEAARENAQLLRGRIRLAAPLSYGISHLAPVLARFMQQHPEILVDVELSDSHVDLVEDGFDLAIRIAALPDSSLRAIRLRSVTGHLIAAPSYVARRGSPDHPDQLADHDCFLYSNIATPETWHLTGPNGAQVAIKPPCRLLTNNGDLMLAPLVAGCGIGYLPDFLCADLIADGKLTTVLPGWHMGELTLNLVMPPSPHRPARVDALIAFLRSNLDG